MRYETQDKPVTTKHLTLGEISFIVEVPQAENFDEAVAMTGGLDALVSFFNSQVATNAKNVARAHARDYKIKLDEGQKLTEELRKELVAKIESKGQGLAHDYSPSAEAAGPSKAKKAAAFDEISALVSSGQEFSREQLFELLQKAK